MEKRANQGHKAAHGGQALLAKGGYQRVAARQLQELHPLAMPAFRVFEFLISIATKQFRKQQKILNTLMYLIFSIIQMN
jgi:hypothetical protein